MELNKIYNESCEETMKRMDDNSIDCCICSPPYWGLRDYGVDGQLGLEKTPEEYVQKMVQIFKEVRRVLKKEGTLWLNLGDNYVSTAPNTMGVPISKKGIFSGISNKKAEASKTYRPKTPKGLKPKDMVGIPWRVAFALQADGWWLRSDIIEEVEFYCPCGCGHIMEERIWRYSQDREIIWKKPNPMPESVTDRPTKAHEYLFLMSKNQKYYYDADAIAEKTFGGDRRGPDRKRFPTNIINGIRSGFHWENRNKRTVWTIPTQPYPGAHFATYPEKLIEPCVLAGCPKEVCSKCGKAVERIVESYIEGIPRNEKGLYAKMNGKDGTCHYLSKTNIHGTKTNKTIGFKPSCNCNAEFVPGVAYDPFGGAMTTALVALRAERNFICSEISPEYCEIGEKRIRPYLDQYKLKL